MGRGRLQKAATAFRPQLVPQGFVEQTDFAQQITSGKQLDWSGNH